MLQAIKADFYIRYDGTEYGDVKPDRSTEKRTRAPRKPLGHLYMADLSKLQPGASHKWTFADSDVAERVRSAATAYSSKNWGTGSYISTLQRTGNAFALEILRLA
jgi:hypothetical protein